MTSTHTLGEGDDTIHYDVRGDLATATAERPALFVYGSPMEAGGLAALADRIDDRPVVTYDPRGSGRNPTGTAPLGYQQHADDVRSVIAALDTPHPVDLFGTSGGAVVAFVLLEQSPDLVNRVVAHEPPLPDLLPDGATLRAVSDDVAATYAAAGNGPAMAKFIQFVMTPGEIPADYLDRPAPDPAMFGMSADDDGDRTNPLMRNLAGTAGHLPDYDRLAAVGDRLVIAVGVGSGEEYPARSGRAIAARVGCRLVEFPSHHAGFAAEDAPFPGEADAFAARLREVLA